MFRTCSCSKLRLYLSLHVSVAVLLDQSSKLLRGPGRRFRRPPRRRQYPDSNSNELSAGMAPGKSALPKAFRRTSPQPRSLHAMAKQLKAQVERDLVVRLDKMLPSRYRSTAWRGGAGRRAVSTNGRSMNQVLHDVVRYVAVLVARHQAEGAWCTQDTAARASSPVTSSSIVASSSTSAGDVGALLSPILLPAKPDVAEVGANCDSTACCAKDLWQADAASQSPTTISPHAPAQQRNEYSSVKQLSFSENSCKSSEDEGDWYEDHWYASATAQDKKLNFFRGVLEDEAEDASWDESVGGNDWEFDIHSFAVKYQYP